MTRSASLPALPGLPDSTSHRLLTLPETADPLSIRAKAMLFQDPRSLALGQQIDLIARSEATVLIIGETGTGKELVARQLHRLSGRGGPFLAVNCGAFSEALIDAELFGHESGAFTGASQARAGWFEAANGGTLFLDEIGDLPMALQVKLLRVLQERQVVRLGSRRALPIHVRLVAATNIDLREAVAASRFRADLYYRLSVAPVALPPLRERPGDILPLAQHFLGVYGPRIGLPAPVLAPDAQAALLAYPWPGNIRELENAVHFALIVCRQGVIRAADLKLVPLSPPLVANEATTPPAAPTPAAPDNSGGGTDAALASAQRQLEEAVALLVRLAPADLHGLVEAGLVREAFDQARQNQVHASRVLGISRNSMRTLLKRHGLL